MFESVLQWLSTARENQMEPLGHWRIWLMLAGRGFGKTRTAAEVVKRHAWERDRLRVGVIAATFADGRDICFEGESGLCNVIPDSCIDIWNRSMGEMRLKNGSIIRLFSADDPDRMRGYQFHLAWADELASYKGKVAQKDAAAEGVPGTPKPMLAQIELATRLPGLISPRIIITTTPRPLKILKEVMARKSTVTTRGSTMENAAFLAPEFMESVLNLYAGTRLGRQELDAEILEDIEGALWNRAMIDDQRMDPKKETLPTFKRIVVAVDPAVTANKRSSETGIVVVGLTHNNRAIVLQDYSGKFSPEQWAAETTRAYQTWGASRIVAEKNNGGDLVERNLRSRDDSKNFPIKLVDATKGKILRAEPVSGLYEQKKVSHWGVFPVLEDQMCTYTGEEGEESPDHMDALVWALTDLMLGKMVVPHVAAPAMDMPNHWAAVGNTGDVGISSEEGSIVMGGW